MFLDTNNYTECCGCGACADICSQNAISMSTIHNGFTYPVIDMNKCTDCGACRKICDFCKDKLVLEENERVDGRCYYGWLIDREERLKSTSGGAFIGIATAFLNKFPNNAVVYGASWVDVKVVKHICINSIDDLECLRKSKYIQSDTTSLFASIKNNLQQGYHVMFSGTPCQAAQLRRYIPPKYLDNLLVVDILCNGVSSQIVFSDYIDGLEHKYKSKLLEYSFRNKDPDKGSHKLVYKLFENNKMIRTGTDLFYVAFQTRKVHRESCFHCKYSNEKHISDITLGDFWEIEKFFPELIDERKYGISLLLPNTNKGEKIIEELGNMHIQSVDRNCLIPGERLVPSLRSSSMDSFYAEYDKKHILHQLMKYVGIKEMVSRKCAKLYRMYLLVRNRKG